MKQTNEQQLNGVVASYNVSPRGFYESLILEAGDTYKRVQLNFAKEVGASVAAIISPGSKVTATAKVKDDYQHLDRPAAEHPVLDLLAITDIPSGRNIKLSGLDDSKPCHVKGVVARLNYAKHGEPNGAILESGAFVHIKPHGAKAVKLAVGQHLDADGDGWSMSDGSVVVEAETVNGIDLAKHKKEKDNEKHRPKMPKHAASHR